MISLNKNIDIMDVDCAPSYDICWTDPPWEDRMVKWFETKMEKDTGAKKPFNNIDEILIKLAKLTNTQKPLFIEYGVKGYERVAMHMTNSGHNLSSCVERLMNNKSPYMILSFNTNIEIENAVGSEIITAVVRNISYKATPELTTDNNGQQPFTPVVWDPFAGIGITRKAVEKAGGKYIGYEINKARFDRMNYEN